MLLTRNMLIEASRTLLPKSWASATEPTVGPLAPIAEPTPALVTASHTSQYLPRRHPKPALQEPSAKEHAAALLDWIRQNVDPSDGPIFHCAMIEHYTEMLLDRGWLERKWNPVAHQFRLLTTGRRKAYAWVQTVTGTPHRLRVYPIPPAACLTGIPVVPSSVTSSFPRAALKLGRAA